MKKQLLLCIAMLFGTVALAQKRIVSGIIKSSADGLPLAGVNIVVKGTTQGTSSDADGKFSMSTNEKETLVFSFIGYNQQEVAVNGESKLDITLIEDVSTLGEVTVVSTGYQFLAKERMNGSFVQLDNQLINRRVGTDILSRMEDVTSGLIFNRNTGQKNDISIRGLSTINSKTQPLIVVDNFPYEGDMNTINPNDVESITVLKDAAAASIWGARAGNGVIVITTKKGAYNQPLKVSLNTNITITQKPDAFYTSLMSPSQVIENEKRLFDQGFYAAREESYSSALTPAVELMVAQRDGVITDSEYQASIASLENHDVRNDYNKYLNRKGINQQYALNLNGGTAIHRYFFSAGWDKNLDNLVRNQYDRITLNMNNSWNLLNEKLTINSGIYYSLNQTESNNIGQTAQYGYAKMRDENGNNLPITNGHRLSFIQQAEQDGLLNWEYVPLDELKMRDNVLKLTDYRINALVNYKIIEGLNAEVLYQYWNGDSQRRNLQNENSFYVRNLINSFSNTGSGIVERQIPMGGILDLTHSSSISQSARAQMSYSKNIGNHTVYALAGYEVREQTIETSVARNYGYNNELATIKPVNYITAFQQYDDPENYLRIPFGDSQSSLTDRFISYYGNLTYSFKDRYSVSGSARRDQSNLFGVRANQRSVPLWSAGIGWTASEEPFYKIAWLPYLKIRTTYGANGNINKQMTAYTTAYSVGEDQFTGQPYSIISNPANPDLRWEKVKVYNAGIDFELKHKRLSGSIEYFSKKGVDLIGTRVFPSSTGVSAFTGNFASTKTYGWDLVLNSINIDNAIRWTTTALFSVNKEKVTDYDTEPQAFDLLSDGSGKNGTVAPFKGKPLFAVYSYQWAGLDPETGDPRGYIDGTVSSDYGAVVTAATPQSLIYHGSARPAVYGSVRNTLSWKSLSLSFNVAFRMGYYIRKNSIRYSQVLVGDQGHGDYASRWQNPGDELNTNVPSIPASIDYNRDDLYLNSEVLVEKGDHIRLQDINLSYILERKAIQRLPFSKVEVYSYLNNVGILWKASSGSLDPDYQTDKPLRSIAFGVRIDF